LRNSLITGGFTFAAAELAAGGSIHQLENIYRSHLGDT